VFSSNGAIDSALTIKRRKKPARAILDFADCAAAFAVRIVAPLVPQ
jgi:hypothetical protein